MLAFESELPISGAVDVEIVVMGSDCEHALVRTECHNLNPLLGILENLAWVLQVCIRSDSHSSIITGDSSVVGTDSDTSGLLGSWEVGESGGTSSLCFHRFVRDNAEMFSLSLCWIPDENLIVITTGDHLSVDLGKSPDFSFVVGVHNFHTFVSIGFMLDDSSIAKTDEHAVS